MRGRYASAGATSPHSVAGATGYTGQELLRLLSPFGCQVTVVRKRSDPLEGARILGWDRRNDALGEAETARIEKMRATRSIESRARSRVLTLTFE